MTIDRLSGGRLVLPVGLGTLDDEGFANVGESTGMAERAERLDESLEILTGLWSGKAFAFEGRHYRFGPMTFRPAPVQRPRIPIWVVGVWPRLKSMRRAARDRRMGRPGATGGGRGTAVRRDRPRHVPRRRPW